MRLIKTALAALSLSLGAATAGASSTSPVDGVDYRTLAEAMPTVPGLKIEVVEFFSYGSPLCSAFDPYLAAWVKARGSDIQFTRVPVAFRQSDELMQRLYYTLELLGKAEVHNKVFDALHVEHQVLDTESRITDFVVRQGVGRKEFLDLFRSFGVQTKIKRASFLQGFFKVAGVPLAAVDGRFEASPLIAGADRANQAEPDLFAGTLKVLDWLVDRAAMARKEEANLSVPARPAAVKKGK